MRHGAQTEQNEGSILLPNVDEIAEFGQLTSGAGFRSALGSTPHKELVQIVLDSERDLSLRFEAARQLSQEVLDESEIEPLLAAVKKSVSWEYDIQAAMREEGDRTKRLYTEEEKLRGQVAALALQDSTLRHKDLRSEALGLFLSANSSHAADENQRAVLMLQRVTAEDEIADFVCHWIAEANRHDWRRDALPLLIGINSEAASRAYARVLFNLPEQDRESSFRREVNRLKKKEQPRVQRKTLSGKAVGHEDGVAELLERLTDGIESAQETLLITNTLLQLSVYRPQNELIDTTLAALREMYGIDGMLLPEHCNLSDGDRMVKAALKATLLPKFKPGDEAEALDAAFDMAVASITHEHAGASAKNTSAIVGSSGGAELRSELAVSVLMDALGLV